MRNLTCNYIRECLFTKGYLTYSIDESSDYSKVMEFPVMPKYVALLQPNVLKFLNLKLDI